MVFGRHLTAILKKEWLYWRRNICRSLLELSIPFILMGVLLALRLTITGETVEGGPSFPQDVVAIDLFGSNYTMGEIFNKKQFYEGFFNINNKDLTYALGIAPNNTDVTKAMLNYLHKRNVRVLGFESEDDLVKYAANPTIKTKDNKYINLTTGISFTSTANKEYSYKLLIDKDYIMDVADNFVDRLQRTPLKGQLDGVTLSGIFYLKTVADTFILRNELKSDKAQITYAYVPMPYGEHKEDMFGNFTDAILGYFFLLSVLLPLITLIGKFMTDKTTRMRESMKIMGINDSTYFLSYFCFYAILQFIVSFGCAGMVKSTLFPKSNYFLLALFFFLFGTAIYPFAIIIWYFWLVYDLN